jgi:UDP-N-acetylglucosamine diphosphorylase/glucosamine-1-phosphate N-acetyltransferase
MPAPQNLMIREGAFLVNKDQILFGNNVEIMPGAVIDASKGSVYLGENVRVESHAAVAGPCYIGADSIVLAGKIVASSIGQVCRVGGEVEESVFLSYVNKFHAGFIGHSYIGSWVNFGAMTTNSDLKNNYSTVRVMQRGEMVDTGQIKVGSCVGDHTKFGIGTLLNTGITIGDCCNIFGAGLTSDKEVSSFKWGNTSAWEEHQLAKALETASRSCGRRNVMLSEREIELLRAAYEQKVDRRGAITF